MAKITVIKKNSDFRRVYAVGGQKVNSSLVCYFKKNKIGTTRVGITSSKKIGNAVERNRARRVIRAAFSELFPLIDGGWDIIFVARRKTCKIKSTRVREVMEAQLREAEIIK